MHPAPGSAPESWTDPRHRLGLSGEAMALKWLTAAGWQIEAHRFRLGRYDVDLIIRRGGLVAFVEVKTRTSRSFGAGIEAIGWRKRQRIARVAAAWAERYGRPGDVYRFDVVAVEFRRGGGRAIEHLADAWRPDSPWRY